MEEGKGRSKHLHGVDFRVVAPWERKGNLCFWKWSLEPPIGLFVLTS